jgi:probable HAF family extracellular repeat protein
MVARSTIVLGVVFLLVVCGLGSAACAQSYRVVDLGSLGSGASTALGINSSGDVCGYSYMTTDTSTGDYRAFVYSNGTMTDIFGGPSSSVAYGINNTGKIVGSAYFQGTSGPVQAAYVYDRTTGHITGALSWGGTYCEGLSINDAGIAVGYTTLPADDTTAYFIIGDLSSTNTYAYGGATGTTIVARAISSDNIFVGDYVPAGGNQTAYMGWLNADMSASIYDLVNLGGTTSVATGLTKVDTTGNLKIVGESDVTGDASFHAFVIDTATGITDLGTLGGTNSVATGINTAGNVVGQADVLGDVGHAFLYTGGTMKDLNSLIPSSSGWVLRSANAINDTDWIVGYGTNAAGAIHAFLLQPGSFFLGDANGDGKVDILDLSTVLTNFDKTGMLWKDGDFDGNGSVGINDLSNILTNFDKTQSSGAGLTAVPEPSTIALLTALLGTVGLAMGWRGRK